MAYTTHEKIDRVRVQAIRMVQGGKSTREVARHFGYAQSTVVKWYKRRHETWHKQELPTRSSRPKRSPRSIGKEIEAQILAVRHKLKRCSEVVHEQLRRDGVVVSLSTVKRVLSRYGMVQKRSPWKKKRRYPLRPDITKQGDLVELDTIHFVDKDGKRTYIYTALDVYSRYGYASISKKATTHHSLVFWRQVQRYFPFPISCVQTDNGPEFGKCFTDNCNVNHRHNHPRSPNENGHLERFNRTLQEEVPKHKLSLRRKGDIGTYLRYYNTKRMHLGIGYKTPKEMLG